MFKHGVLAIALATMISAASLEAADCGCSSCQPVQSRGCQSQCNPCPNPFLDFLTGVKYNIGIGLCKVKSGVHKVLNPITFNGNCCSARVSDCGCDTSYSPIEYGSPEIHIIESPIQTQETSIPNPPVPPTDESNIIIPEPARFQPPGQWQPTTLHQQNYLRNQQLYYSRVMAERARLYGNTNQPVGYYAPAPMQRSSRR
ncbi:MAG: hypothetical protein COA78_20540 [Blastopirellula sp.]|nr:MAG: hypothetical protein COA78_20540 [Blastopirellula sp.]